MDLAKSSRRANLTFAIAIVCALLSSNISAEPLGIRVSPSSFPLSVDEEISLELTGYYTDGSSSNVAKLASWSNLNTQCASLSSHTVRGLSPGIATVTATYAGLVVTSVLSVTSIAFETNYSTIKGSSFGASAAAWAANEGWTNFSDAGVHYMRMPVDVTNFTRVDGAFLGQYDSYVRTGQTYGIIMYGIVNPVKSGTTWPWFVDFTDKLEKVVEHYDGDGTNDMSGLEYPIKQWEICNEIQYHDSLSTGNQWYGCGKARYHEYLTNSMLSIRRADPQCSLLNGAQIAPPSSAIAYEGTSTLWNVITEMGSGAIDAISYHDYDELLEADQAIADFETLGVTDKTIWVSEADMQWAWDKNNNRTQDDNARLLPQGFAYALTKGCDKIIAASMRAGLGDPQMVQWGSLVDPATGTRRKVYYAFRKLVEKIDYATASSVNSFQSGINNYGLRFFVSGKPVVMLWSTSNCVYRYATENTNASAVKITPSAPSDGSGHFVVEHCPVTNNETLLIFSNTAIYVEELTNSRSSGLSANSYLPDLAITSVSLTPANVAASRPFAASLVVTNRGFGAASNFHVSVWADKATAAADSSGESDGMDVTNVLDAFESVAFSFTNFVAGGPSTQRTFRAFVDSDLVVDERNEANNQTTVAYTPRAYPDFVVTAIDLDPDAPVYGKTFSARVTVSNQGTASGSGGYLYVYANKPEEVAVRTRPTKTASVGTVAAGSNKTITVSGLRAGSDGQKTFRAYVDGSGARAEICEDNNQMATNYTVIRKPDLTVPTITFSPATPARGGVFSAAVEVKNKGSCPATNVYVSIWVNKLSVPTNGADDTTGAMIGTIATNSTASYTFANLDAGTGKVARTFRAFADSDNDLDEVSESNNQRTKSYTPASRPDFIITGVSLSPANPTAGSNFAAYVTVKNQGYAAGYANYVDVWANRANDVFAASTNRGDKYAYAGYLYTNRAKTVTLTGLSAGSIATQRVFRALVDSRNGTTEICETNNQATATYTPQ